MRKTAVLLIVFGFAFVFFRIEAFGIDLLMDAAGYVLVFNGVRALGKVHGGFGISPALCIVLVLVTAVQIFLSGVPLVAVSLVRTAPEMCLFFMMAAGFYALAKADGRAWLGGILFALFAASAAASLLAGLDAVPYFAAIGLFHGFVAGFSLTAHIALCVTLAVFAFLCVPASGEQAQK